MAAQAIALVVSGGAGLLLTGCGGAGPDSTAAPSEAYDEQEALLHGHLASAAFCDHASLETWTCGPACDNVLNMADVRPFGSKSASGYVGVLGGDCVVSFRGTINVGGVADDLKSATKSDLNSAGIACFHNLDHCQVGTGFLGHYLSVSEEMKEHLGSLGCQNRSLRITGHSLGAAVAAIAAVDLLQLQYSVRSLYTFGQPRVGNDAFVSATNALIADRVAVHWRLTHHQDPVPHLPFQSLGFAHLRGEVYYENTTREGYRICESGAAEDPRCAAQWTNTASLLMNCARMDASPGQECDHMTYLEGLIPYLMGPSGCVSPSNDGDKSTTGIVV